ncbi:MAG: hypothetical protein GC154_08075 [bacterium]|nr:hypothetical protein [bacterium]
MVRGKKSRKLTSPEPSAQPPTPSPRKAEKRSVTRSRFYFYDYLVISIVFVVFCYIQKWVIMKYFIGASGFETYDFEKYAVNFFFDTLWKGFVIVTFLVWLHDVFYRDTQEDDTT